MQMDIIDLQTRKKSNEHKEQIKQELIEGLVGELSKEQLLTVCNLFDKVVRPYIVSK